MKIWSLSLVLAVAWPCAAEEAASDGYAQLVAAGKMVKPGENGYPSATEFNLPSAENLRRQRLAVERNAPALAAVREALKQNIVAPDPKGEIIGPGATLRELARQFIQESEVRAANGDWVGAVDSRLTAMEMGAASTRNGYLIPMLVGVAIEAIGRRDIEKSLAHLDAPALRVALERLKNIDARRAPLSEIDKVEKQLSIDMGLKLFNEPDFSQARARVATKEGREEFGLTKSQGDALLALSPQNFKLQMESFYDAIAARNQLPYQQSVATKLPKAQNEYVENSIETIRSLTYRFNYERNIAAQRLLEGAVELRAIKLETGAYPETFNAGVDPFSDGRQLAYRRKGGNYQLYSIGPDGEDNGGAKFKTSFFSYETGTMKSSKNLAKDSKGDILAPAI